MEEATAIPITGAMPLAPTVPASTAIRSPTTPAAIPLSVLIMRILLLCFTDILSYASKPQVSLSQNPRPVRI
jgi:hypothetical protein